ncbi:TIR domain-containing protein [Mesorhizobium sp.]|uniref:TIR domain-containing protein n=1 Tax=Mesorhizobium sp. TaxID=1871066 RepID=UPI0012220CAE|nr:TIR domain-containing protein [Mesorhizobium sp.]TIL67461.1 MAG: TIR domain-containing protein [Mesorhizobium sp.]
MVSRRHLFISHHHADDARVSGLTSMLTRSGYEIRNSSIRAKSANRRRLDEGRIPERTLKRLLRMKISWASTVVVLIGKNTHQRPWVDWEIKKANELGKRIVGVYERGGTENDIPEALKKYGDARVGWNSASIIDAIEGTSDPFENPDGTPSQPAQNAPRGSCAA